MFQLTRKQRKAVLTAAVTLSVYAGFRFLLPLLLPFFLSYLIALFLRPSALWLERRLRVTFLGRERTIPLGIIGGAELLILTGVFGILFYFGGLCFLREAQRLAQAVPEWLSVLAEKLTELCRRTEVICRLEEGSLVEWMQRLLREAAAELKNTQIPALLFHSFGAIGFLIKAAVAFIVFLIAVILSLQEMEEWRSRRFRSLFHREFFLLGRRVCQTGSAWFKTQAVILSVTSSLCILSLACMGNPYAVLAGIGIGLLDALPIFGVGTVLLPWSALLFLRQQWGWALWILVLDLVCYFFREYAEAKLMGKKVGLSALETLISIYAGLKLFGGLGFILGPVGLLIIRDFIEEYDDTRGKRL